jgi:hypothetical protein
MEGGQKFHLTGNELPIGVGRENEVFNDPTSERRLIALAKYERGDNPRAVKGSYYLTKIIHLLYPESIPDLHMATLKPKATVRQKMELGELHNALRAKKLEEYGLSIEKAPPHLSSSEITEKIFKNKQIQELVATLEMLGLHIDKASVNFGISDAGDPRYIEVFPAFDISKDNIAFPLYGEKSLRRAIDNIKDADRRVKALHYFDRLTVLRNDT